MRIANIILGIVAAIVGMILTLGIMFDAYQPANYDISLQNDTSTAALYDMQEEANAHYATMQESYEYSRKNTPGQELSTLNPQIGLTESDLQQSALSTLKESGTYLNTFTSMVTTFFNTLDLRSMDRTVLIWFIGLLVGVPLVMLLINSLLRNPM